MTGPPIPNLDPTQYRLFKAATDARKAGASISEIDADLQQRIGMNYADLGKTMIEQSAAPVTLMAQGAAFGFAPQIAGLVSKVTGGSYGATSDRIQAIIDRARATIEKSSGRMAPAAFEFGGAMASPFNPLIEKAIPAVVRGAKALGSVAKLPFTKARQIEAAAQTAEAVLKRQPTLDRIAESRANILAQREAAQTATQTAAAEPWQARALRRMGITPEMLTPKTGLLGATEAPAPGLLASVPSDAAAVNPLSLTPAEQATHSAAVAARGTAQDAARAAYNLVKASGGSDAAAKEAAARAAAYGSGALGLSIAGLLSTRR